LDASSDAGAIRWICAHDEEGCAERKDVQALEIQVAAIHDVERSGLRQHFVEDVDVVHFAGVMLINVGCCR